MRDNAVGLNYAFRSDLVLKVEGHQTRDFNVEQGTNVYTAGPPEGRYLNHQPLGRLPRRRAVTHGTSIPMRSNVVCTLAIALALATLPAGARRLEAQAPGYSIVVHASNPVSSISREEASKLFLRKTPKWSTGADVVPVDLPEGSSVREAFTKAVLKKSVSAVKSYWQQQIFSGRGVPPTEKASDADVVSFVRANPNAIGYVSATTPVGNSVKVVAVRSN